MGRNGRNRAAPAMLNMLPKLELLPIRMYFVTFCTVARPWTIASCTTESSCCNRIRSAICRAVDRNAYIRGVQGGRIVNAIAEETDDMAHPLQPEQDSQLLLRRHAAE